MCLIAYSPDGAAIPDDVFNFAHRQNSDGIGIMCERGVSKYFGKKAPKRARHAMRVLAAEGIPFGIHFRWATHGKECKELCHPFIAADGNTCVMHNGVINQTARLTSATAMESDTSLLVDLCMRHAPAPGDNDYDYFYQLLGEFIGSYNKLLVFHYQQKQWTIVNEDSGIWIEGFWYSNTYSLPAYMDPWKTRYGKPKSTGYSVGAAYSWPDDSGAVVITPASDAKKGDSAEAPTKSAEESARVFIGADGQLRMTNAAPETTAPVPDMRGTASNDYADRNVGDALDTSESHALAKIADYERNVAVGNAEADWGAQLGRAAETAAAANDE